MRRAGVRARSRTALAEEPTVAILTGLLVTLLTAGVLAVAVACRSYPRDVATALASEQATGSDDDRAGRRQLGTDSA